MKVVMPVGALHLGGGCKILTDVANALHARGHETEVLVPEGMPVDYDVHCKLTRIPSLSKEHIPYGDIVLTNFYTTFRPAFEAWPAQCVRFSQAFEPLWVWDREVAIWTYQQNVPIISISRWLDDQIFLHTHRRSTVINIGIDPRVFSPDLSPKPKDSARPKVILYIARDPEAGYQLKGFTDFQKSMEIVKQTYLGKFVVHLICTERILPLPGIPHKTFQPKTEQEMADLYRSADLFVSTSWFEAFGLPPLEAMACGTPVVTTNSGGVLDFATHLESAYITQPQNPESIAKGILSVLTNAGLARKLREGGLASAARLTTHQFEQKMVDTLEQIHQARRKGNRSGTS